MFSTLDTFDTEYSADSVEWCPAEGFKDLFVCGTYQLVPGEEKGGPGKSSELQKRLGKIYLLQVIENGKLRLLSTLETAAVLDMKWSHVCIRGNIFLGVVNSIGYLQIYRLHKKNEPELSLVIETKISKDEEQILALSLDWNTGRSKDDCENDVQISVSDSKGSVSLYQLSEDNLELVSTNKLHDFEAWITAFDYWNPNLIYSGGDDCKFHRLDARLGLKSIATNRQHDAGVTSLRCNAQKEFCLASGSYDEVLRIWDTRNFRKPVSKTNLNGGIWRLKWDPRFHEYLFAACMYGGFRIVDCKEEVNPRIVDEYNEHKSIAYGCDWCFLSSSFISTEILKNSSNNVVLTATCSFYDHTLKLSTFDTPIN